MAGPEVSPLYFDLPLSGTYEFSLCQAGDAGSETALQLGRVVFEPCANDNKVVVRSIGEQEVLSRPRKPQEMRDSYRVRVTVTPERVRYYVDDALQFEDSSPSPTTPWLALVSRAALECLDRSAVHG